nr:hypothetical protein RAR13_11940 [Aminobacter aminovorans]
MSEKLETLDDIKRAYPLVFECRAMLLAKIAQIETEYVAAKERRACADDAEQDYYDAFRRSWDPVRRELEVIDRSRLSGRCAALPTPQLIPALAGN